MNQEATLTDTTRSSCGGTECGGNAPAVRPAYRVERRDQGVSLHIALPGVAKGDAKVAIEDGLLTVRAPRETQVPESWKTHQALPVAGDYLLQVRLHRDLDPATAQAELRDGVLTLALDRHEETLPRTIEIN